MNKMFSPTCPQHALRERDHVTSSPGLHRTSWETHSAASRHTSYRQFSLEHGGFLWKSTKHLAQWLTSERSPRSKTRIWLHCSPARPCPRCICKTIKWVAHLPWLSMPKNVRHTQGKLCIIDALMRNATTTVSPDSTTSLLLAPQEQAAKNKTKCRSSLDLAFKLQFPLYCIPLFILCFAGEEKLHSHAPMDVSFESIRKWLKFLLRSFTNS